MKKVPLSQSDTPLVAVVMGSQSDWSTMRHACEMLEELCVPYISRIVSAHRTPKRLREFAEKAPELGLQYIIAGAGGAAHLPGMLAAEVEPTIPVLGVPMQSSALSGVDSVCSILQMPSGVPVATFSIGKAGAQNAALFAASCLAKQYDHIRTQVRAYRDGLTLSVPEEPKDE